MTDRHAGYLVTLSADIREDDAEDALTALRMVRGVAAVEPVTADPLNDQIARTRRDQYWAESLRAIIREMLLRGAGKRT